MAFDKDTQKRIFRVADARSRGEEIDEMDARIAWVMDLHPEFEPLWPNGELSAIPQEINGQIVNPFVHTVLHTIVDRQILNQDPEFVAETHRRLMGEGIDEHDSLHAIISQYADLYFSSVRRGGGQFDQLEYQSRLARISVSDGPQKGGEGR
ncbi:MAG: DUF1841 family protein [Nitrospinae bacterium]|nr:DUF1841 family protein [Nitrospinota bacterium]